MLATEIIVIASKMSLTIFCLIALAWPNIVQANPDAKRLYDDLLSNYNRLIRPVANNTDKITVRMGLKLSQLVDLVSANFFNSEQFYGTICKPECQRFPEF